MKRRCDCARGILSAVLRKPDYLASIVEPIGLGVVAARQGGKGRKLPLFPNGAKALTVIETPDCRVAAEFTESLMRVIFLLSQADRQYRNRLIKDSVAGRPWHRRYSRQLVTDREMTELTDTRHGWTKSVYAFGCTFMQLAECHNHDGQDPLDQLTEAERYSILKHLRYYHGGASRPSPRFSDLVPLLPRAFVCFADCLECCLKHLEQDGGIAPEEA